MSKQGECEELKFLDEVILRIVVKLQDRLEDFDEVVFTHEASDDDSGPSSHNSKSSNKEANRIVKQNNPKHAFLQKKLYWLLFIKVFDFQKISKQSETVALNSLELALEFLEQILSEKMNHLMYFETYMIVYSIHKCLITDGKSTI